MQTNGITFNGILYLIIYLLRGHGTRGPGHLDLIESDSFGELLLLTLKIRFLGIFHQELGAVQGYQLHCLNLNRNKSSENEVTFQTWLSNPQNVLLPENSLPG